MTTPAGPPAPDDFLEYRLVRLADRLSQRFSAALGPHELSPRQFSVLAVLAANPGVTSAELARAVLTTPQSMHTLLEQLQRRDLVDRGEHRGRGRAAGVRPTGRGMDLLAAAGERVVALEAETREQLGEEDYGQLVRLLGRFEDIVAPTHRSGR